jgi:hypothetical protein
MNLTPPDDKVLHGIIRDEEWYLAATRTRVEDKLRLFCAALNAFDDLRIGIISRVARVSAATVAMRTMVEEQRTRNAKSLMEDASQLHHQLMDAEARLHRMCEKHLIPTKGELRTCDSHLQELHAAHFKRYSETTKTDTAKCLAVLVSLSEECRKTAHITTGRRLR